MIIAVDFDGTIVEHKFPEIGKEINEGVSYLKTLQSLGHKIIIWTCREKPYIKPMLNWLEERGFVPDAVNENIDKNLDFAKHKIYADIYVDDRGFPKFDGDINWYELLEYVMTGVERTIR